MKKAHGRESNPSPKCNAQLRTAFDLLEWKQYRKIFFKALKSPAELALIKSNKCERELPDDDMLDEDLWKNEAKVQRLEIKLL